MSNSRIFIAILIASLASTTAVAQLYKHVDERGRVIYSDAPPTTNSEVKTLTKQGRVAAKQDAALTSDQQKAAEIEAARRKEADRLYNEQRRRDLTLIATYTSDRDIEVALSRNIEPIDARTRSAQERITALETKEQDIANEMEFYKAGKRKVTKGKEAKDAKAPEVPPDLIAQAANTAREKQQLIDSIAKNDRDVTELKARFAADKARWQALRGGVLPGNNPEPQFQTAKADDARTAVAAPAKK
jgi:hypothetical protein